MYINGATRDYGPDWHKQRRLARDRDGYACRICAITREELGEEPNVHHIIPWRELQSNELGNLICLCRSCHRKVEIGTLNLDEAPEPVISFVIPGEFVSERKRQVRTGTFTRRVDMADRAEFKAKVALFAAQVAPPEPLYEPLRLEAVWQSVKPASYRKHEDWPWKKPDLDNLVKILLDPLSCLLFRDDAQICELLLRKQFGPTEQVSTRIWKLCEEWRY